jgi:acetyltransferase-like isoleucine patch superfamily enzyme
VNWALNECDNVAEHEQHPENRMDLSNGSVAWSPCVIGENLTIGELCSIGCLAHIGRNVIIGNNSRIQGGAYIADKCVLGNNVFIGPNATLLNDKYPPSGDSKFWQPVIIEDYAVIGGGSTIIPGCKVGKYSVLAAGAVLTHDLPRDEVWSGNPARYLMTRKQYDDKRGD